MDTNDILAAIAAARTYKPTETLLIASTSARPENSFVSVYDQLDQLDRNPFDVPRE